MVASQPERRLSEASVLDLILTKMLKSHLEKGTNSKVTKYDDDTELRRVVKLEMDFKEVPDGLYECNKVGEIQD